MAKYLVTGGAGFIGSNLARFILQQGHDVVVLDNFATGKRENLDEIADRIELIEADIRDRSAVDKAVAGCAAVFHEAALGSVPRSVADPLTSHDVNVNGTVNLLEAARAAGVRRVVFAASSSAYGDQKESPKHEAMVPLPISPYAASKVACEAYMRAYAAVYGLETLSLRYFNVFGPRQDPRSSAESFGARSRWSSATASRAGISATSTTSARRIGWLPMPPRRSATGRL